MGWLKGLLGTDENKYTKMLKSAEEKETLEKEFQALPDMGRMASLEDKESAEIDRIEDENAQQLEPARAAREKEFQAALDQLLVIDGAKLECPLCTNPQGILKVNFDTPTTQDKKTATIKEKDASSLIFMGNCKKSPKSASPCASVMKLGEWKDTGNMKIQDQPPLLLKSSIPCLYGGSNIKITDSGQINEPEITDLFGDYAPLVSSLQWLDKENKEITQNKKAKVLYAETDHLIDFSFSDIHYGEELKLVLKLNKGREEKEISVSIRSNKGDFSKDFGKLPVNANQEVETPYFTVPILGYDESAETYHYSKHVTTVQEDDIQKTHAVIQGIDSAEKKDQLIPFIYRRNYEELIGLFNTDNSGSKDLVANYENHFITKSPSILEIAKGFSTFINTTEVLALEQVKKRVEQDAKKLWHAAAQEVQGGALDDRPLYWARNKMQVRLKQHPLFKNDIDFERSIVKKDTELEKIIQLFEEKSRNYTGIDFSKAPLGAKKVLITGFDPFVLNQFDNNSIETYSPNILQSNPSGVVALALTIENIYIQTMIVPVRYTDFDSSQEYDQGQGEGIIEKYIKPWISQVDMIITMSQYLKGQNVIDMFATSRRGGFNDNMDFIRESGFQALQTNSEWIQTSLPRSFNIPGIKINWNFNDIGQIENTYPNQEEILTSGSGGDYLSNEIFYRVAKLRKELRPNLATGHFHIEKLQDEEIKEDFSNKKMKTLLDFVKKGIEEGVKGIEKK